MRFSSFILLLLLAGPFNFTALAQDPDNVIHELRAYSITTHSFTLSWKTRTPPSHPKSYKISYSATKEFRDSQGVQQLKIVSPRHVKTRHLQYTVVDLEPFTSYKINVTAVTESDGFNPPGEITVITAMAAPQPMVKPDFYMMKGDDQISVILPQASEEFGPISHYYLVVVPEKWTWKSTDQFPIEELTNVANRNDESPYIAAKFVHQNIPFTFVLGDKQDYNGFINKPLIRGKTFRIFVRAVVDTRAVTPKQYLYTSSPFSDPLSLDMSTSDGRNPHDNEEEPKITEVSSVREYGKNLLVQLYWWTFYFYDLFAGNIK